MKNSIFVVDDEKAICEGLLEILDEGEYKVFTYADGEEALAQFSIENPDLCIIDIKMPGMNGIELTEKLKKIKPGIKILLLTGSVKEISNSKISELGVKKVLEKPISRKDVLFSVRDTLGFLNEENSKDVQNETESISKDDDLVLPKEELPFTKEELPLTKDVKKVLWTKEKILIVDDNKELRTNLRDALVSHNYSVNTAKNGVEALEMVRDEDYGIILMDMHMPEMGGTEAIEKIKSLKPQAFIIVITGEADDEEIRKAIGKGGYACIRKPFTIKKLLKSLEWYSDAERNLKRKYRLAEKIGEFSKIQKISHNFRNHLKSVIASNRMRIITFSLGFASVVIGLLILFFIQFTSDSFSQFVDKKVSKYDNYVDKIIGYLARDERRELER